MCRQNFNCFGRDKWQPLSSLLQCLFESWVSVPSFNEVPAPFELVFAVQERKQ